MGSAHQTPKVPTSTRPVFVRRRQVKAASIRSGCRRGQLRSQAEQRFHIRSKSHNSRAANPASPILDAQIRMGLLERMMKQNRGNNLRSAAAFQAAAPETEEAGQLGHCGPGGRAAHEQSWQNNAAYTTPGLMAHRDTCQR